MATFTVSAKVEHIYYFDIEAETEEEAEEMATDELFDHHPIDTEKTVTVTEETEE
jgi:hypothetical protein